LQISLSRVHLSPLPPPHPYFPYTTLFRSRRYHLGRGPTAEGHGAVLRAPEGRGDQLRDARPGAPEDLLARLVGRLEVDRLDLQEREVPLRVLRRSDLARDGIAGIGRASCRESMDVAEAGVRDERETGRFVV